MIVGRIDPRCYVKQTIVITAGVIAGSATAVLALIACLSVLWLARRWWYEASSGDSLQYIDLMIGLQFTAALLIPSVVILGGLIGGRWVAIVSSRRMSPNLIKDIRQP